MYLSRYRVSTGWMRLVPSRPPRKEGEFHRSPAGADHVTEARADHQPWVFWACNPAVEEPCTDRHGGRGRHRTVARRTTAAQGSEVVVDGLTLRPRDPMISGSRCVSPHVHAWGGCASGLNLATPSQVLDQTSSHHAAETSPSLMFGRVRRQWRTAACGSPAEYRLRRERG